MSNPLKKLITIDKERATFLEGEEETFNRMAALDDEELRDLTESYKGRQKGR